VRVGISAIGYAARLPVCKHRALSPPGHPERMRLPCALHVRKLVDRDCIWSFERFRGHREIAPLTYATAVHKPDCKQDKKHLAESLTKYLKTSCAAARLPALATVLRRTNFWTQIWSGPLGADGWAAGIEVPGFRRMKPWRSIARVASSSNAGSLRSSGSRSINMRRTLAALSTAVARRNVALPQRLDCTSLLNVSSRFRFQYGTGDSASR
jgi:hypothetical protein